MSGSAHTLATARVARWLAVLLWCGAIFYMSTLPPDDVPSRFSCVAHFGEYAVLGALLATALAEGRAPSVALAVTVLAGSLYGVTDEVHQAFVPGRVPDVTDWGVDTLGVLVGALAVHAIASRCRSRLQRADRRRAAAP